MHPQSILPDHACDPAVTRIPLRARDGTPRAYALVDTADAAWVQQWRWRMGGGGYAVRHGRLEGRVRTVSLHRELLGLPWVTDGREGDHINHNRLDNRRQNLRILSVPHNRQNRPSRAGHSSRYRGVTWHTPTQRWAAMATVEGCRVFLGYYGSERDAARAAACWRVEYMPGTVEDPALLADGPPVRNRKRGRPARLSAS